MTTTIKNITYKINAEVKLTGKAAEGNYISLLELVRPKGNKTFTAMRTKEGSIELI